MMQKSTSGRPPENPKFLQKTKVQVPVRPSTFKLGSEEAFCQTSMYFKQWEKLQEFLKFTGVDFYLTRVMVCANFMKMKNPLLPEISLYSLSHGRKLQFFLRFHIFNPFQSYQVSAEDNLHPFPLKACFSPISFEEWTFCTQNSCQYFRSSKVVCSIFFYKFHFLIYSRVVKFIQQIFAMLSHYLI